MVSGIGISMHGLRAAYGTTEVLRGVDLSVGGGEILALLGPSGCGKTTLLRCVAGLEHPTGGTILIGDHEVTSGKGVPAERRRVGMVFQDGALFAHRSVVNNVNYGVPRGPQRAARAREALRLVGLEDKADRMPGMLSGGEQQRVAVARALAAEPSIVLLDEPFSSLDAALRVELRSEVRELLKQVGMTTMLVTHDQEEAMSFGDRVAVMHDGLIEQIGTPQEIYSAPITTWVARFVGEAVLMPARMVGSIAHTELGAITTNGTADGDRTVMLRPEQIMVRAGGPAVVCAVTYLGADTRYEIAAPGTETTIVSRVPGAPRFEEGDSVTIAVGDVIAHVLDNPA